MMDRLIHILMIAVAVLSYLAASPRGDPTTGEYPWHTSVVATTFWVGEIFDPTAADGSQVVSTYDPQWLAHYADLNDATAFAHRCEVVPWAGQSPPARCGDREFSYMKDRWVRLRSGNRECYGQIEDAGPGVYDDAAYVFGADDPRPANTRFNNAGLDVSPALNGCLGFTEPDGDQDHVDWQFVNEADVPPGPWRTLAIPKEP